MRGASRELWAHVLELSAAECLASLSSDPMLGRRGQLMPFYSRMRSYALVSRAWADVAQRLLFREVTQPVSTSYGRGFHPGGRLRGLERGLLHLAEIFKAMHGRNAKALLAVRSVLLATGYTPISYFGPFAVIVEVLSYCPRISDLHLIVGDLEASPRLSDSETQVVTALTELRRLAIVCALPQPRSAVESHERGALPLDDLVRATAARLERLELRNIHGSVWRAVNSCSFPRLAAAAVHECGPPDDALRLPAHAPALRALDVRLADRHRLSTPADASGVGLRDLRVAVTWGAFDAAGLRELDRAVVLWPRSPYADAECVLEQLRALNASARAVEFVLAGPGAAGVPIVDKLAAVHALAQACRRAPRIALAVIHRGSGPGVRAIPPSVLDQFPCEVRVDEMDDAMPLDEIMRIVGEVESARQRAPECLRLYGPEESDVCLAPGSSQYCNNAPSKVVPHPLPSAHGLYK